MGSHNFGPPNDGTILADDDRLQDGKTPVVRIAQLTKAIIDTNTFAGSRPPAQALPRKFLCFVLVLHPVANASAAGADTTVNHFDQPYPKQIRASLQAIGAHAAE